MSDFVYPYARKRREFGKPCRFEDGEIKLLASIPSEEKPREKYVLKNPITVSLDNQDEYSEHAVNTERVVAVHKGMKHLEGGWPKEIDSTEINETSK